MNTKFNLIKLNCVVPKQLLENSTRILKFIILNSVMTDIWHRFRRMLNKYFDKLSYIVTFFRIQMHFNLNEFNLPFNNYWILYIVVLKNKLNFMCNKNVYECSGCNNLFLFTDLYFESLTSWEYLTKLYFIYLFEFIYFI